MIKAGTFCCDILPKSTCYLVGYAGEARKHPAIGIHDAPKCVILVLEINNKKIVFITLDVCTMNEKYSINIKERISKIYGIDKDYITISTIHTHSGPNGFEGDSILGKANEQYVNESSETILEAVKIANEKLSEVTVNYGHINIEGFYGNRNDKNTPSDKEIKIIKFDNNENKTIASLISMSCHCTVLGPNNMYCSSDLIGQIRSKMTDYLGCIPIIVNGACGDISNRQYRKGNDFLELDRISSGIVEQLKKINKWEELNLENVSMDKVDFEINYKTDKLIDQFKDRLKKVKELLNSGNLSFDENKLLTTENLMLSNRIEYDPGEIKFTIKCKIYKMNDIEIITIPGELFSRLGLKIKKQSKCKCAFIIGYADSYIGYLVEKESFGTNYEAIATNTPKGKPEELVDKIIEKL